MSELVSPDCQIFVDADVAETELIGIIMRLLLATPGDGPPRCEAEVVRNPDYDPARRRRFPDGFIYFRYFIDLYSDDDLSLAGRAALVTAVLERLWDDGFPAVAACGYESRLPHGGGYKSRAVPWPA